MIFSPMCMEGVTSPYFTAASKSLKTDELLFLCLLLSEGSTDTETDFVDGEPVYSSIRVDSIEDFGYSKNRSEELIQKLLFHNFIEIHGMDIFIGVLRIDVSDIVFVELLTPKKSGVASIDFETEYELLSEKLSEFPTGRKYLAGEKTYKESTLMLSRISTGFLPTPKEFVSFWASVYHLVYQDEFRPFSRADYGIIKKMVSVNGAEKVAKAIVSYIIASSTTKYCDPKGLQKDFSKYINNKTTVKNAAGFA